MAKLDKTKAIKMYAGADGVYLSVPEFDKLGNPHAGAAINNDRFDANKIYYVSQKIGDELERILEVYDAQTLSLLMSKVNKRALAQLGARQFVLDE